MTAPVLRPYQDAAVADFERAVAAGQRRILLVAPTASGKTVIFSDIIKHYVEQYCSVLVISHRREIIGQTSKKLAANGVAHGIIQAGIDPRPMARVQVASIATLHVRTMRRQPPIASSSKPIRMRCCSAPPQHRAVVTAAASAESSKPSSNVRRSRN